ncbi:MAG: ABC transporter ATP-binding protein [Telluria sp.]
MLELRNVRKSYGGRDVLRGISHRIEAGEFVAVMGESGVGKSTLLNLIAGLDQPDSGDIAVAGQSLAALDDRAATLLRRRQMGFVFQAFHVLPHLTLEQNVALPLLLNALPLDAARPMLDAVGLAGRYGDFPRQLSGGELQRVAIARALVHRPAIVLADEPTGNLDPETAESILGVLKNELRRNHACAVMVTHSPAAAQKADRTVILTGSELLAR